MCVANRLVFGVGVLLAWGCAATDSGQPVAGARMASTVVTTEIMHGPLAGMGYECRLHSGVAGWTVDDCKVSWVS